MTSIFKRLKHRFWPWLLCCLCVGALFSFNPVWAQECEGELKGLGLEQGWIQSEGKGYSEGRAQQRLELAFQDALDQLVKGKLLAGTGKLASYAEIQPSLLKNYQDFLARYEGEPVYCTLNTGKDTHGKRYTQILAYFDRIKLVQHLEAQQVIEAVRYAVKVILLPENLSESLSQPALSQNDDFMIATFNKILLDRHLKVIGYQEIRALLDQDQALKTLYKPQTAVAPWLSKLREKYGADIIVGYALKISVTHKTAHDIFYQSELILTVRDSNTGQVLKKQNYQSRSIGLPHEGDNQTLQRAAINEAIRPAADEIAQLLTGHWQTQRQRGISYKIVLKQSTPQKIAQVKTLFSQWCQIGSADTKQLTLSCRFNGQQTFDDYWVQAAGLGRLSGPPELTIQF
jgi:hypothetical protein